MANVLYKEREDYLNNDEKWNKARVSLSQKFWKTDLVKYFKKGALGVKDTGNFKWWFNRYVVNKILEKKHLRELGWPTRKSLMSLFSKFGHFYKKHTENIAKDVAECLCSDEYLFDKFWNNFVEKIDKYLLENMDPKSSTMDVALEINNSIDDLCEELWFDITEEDREKLNRFLMNRYDEYGNIDA